MTPQIEDFKKTCKCGWKLPGFKILGSKDVSKLNIHFVVIVICPECKAEITAKGN
jgi:hypothetical protein